MPPMPSMPPESAPGSTGLDDPRPWPAGHGPEDEPRDDPRDEPDPDWPDDWPNDDQAGPSWPGMPPPARGGGGIPVRRALALAVVALVALAAGAGVALILRKAPSSAPSAAASRPPAAHSFGGLGNNGNGGALPGSGGGGGRVQMFVGGQVLAVSGTSITIGGPNHVVTAAVTSSTRVTGRGSSIRSVRVGDLVTAQITQSGGQATATAIQDPARLPPGSSAP